MSNPDVVTFDMFCDEYHRWRKMSGERQWSLETMDRVFQDMGRTYLRLSACVSRRHLKITEHVMIAALDEHAIRQAYRVGLFSPGSLKGRSAEMRRLSAKDIRDFKKRYGKITRDKNKPMILFGQTSLTGNIWRRFHRLRKRLAERKE